MEETWQILGVMPSCSDRERMVLEGGLTESIIVPSLLHPSHLGKRQDSLIEKERAVNFVHFKNN